MNFSNKPIILLVFLSVFLQGKAQKSPDSSATREVIVNSELKPDEDLSLELGSEKVSIQTRRAVDLLSSPGASGIVIGKLKKGVEVQQLDIIGDHYLVCYMGKCGYIPKKFIIKIREEKIKSKTTIDSIPSFKSGKT